MDFHEALSELIQNEESKMKKYILFMLHKFSQLVQQVETEGTHLPLLVMKEDSLSLVYRNEEIDLFDYIFRDYEEILIILQKHFSEDKILYVYFEAAGKEESKTVLLALIEEALSTNNHSLFQQCTQKLIKRGD